ncbi:hypothetical protein Bbelb_353810 [Branchiostoma belcheri]|nr:hypothetical protein Bbelb_353810 [Branchiostoma belcheri]
MAGEQNVTTSEVRNLNETASVSSVPRGRELNRLEGGRWAHMTEQFVTSGARTRIVTPSRAGRAYKGSRAVGKSPREILPKPAFNSEPSRVLSIIEIINNVTERSMDDPSDYGVKGIEDESDAAVARRGAAAHINPRGTPSRDVPELHASPPPTAQTGTDNIQSWENALASLRDEKTRFVRASCVVIPGSAASAGTRPGGASVCCNYGRLKCGPRGAGSGPITCTVCTAPPDRTDVRGSCQEAAREKRPRDDPLAFHLCGSARRRDDDRRYVLSALLHLSPWRAQSHQSAAPERGPPRAAQLYTRYLCSVPPQVQRIAFRIESTRTNDRSEECVPPGYHVTVPAFRSELRGRAAKMGVDGPLSHRSSQLFSAEDNLKSESVRPPALIDLWYQSGKAARKPGVWRCVYWIEVSGNIEGRQGFEFSPTPKVDIGYDPAIASGCAMFGIPDVPGNLTASVPAVTGMSEYTGWQVNKVRRKLQADIAAAGVWAGHGDATALITPRAARLPHRRERGADVTANFWVLRAAGVGMSGGARGPTGGVRPRPNRPSDDAIDG